MARTGAGCLAGLLAILCMPKPSGWEHSTVKISKPIMLILDTDHLSEMDRGSELGIALRDRITPHAREVFVTVVTAEESLRGWLAAINVQKASTNLIYAYSRLDAALHSLEEWMRLGWDEDSARIFDQLKAGGVTIGTMDLRIASIALAYEATLLSRNLKDFQQVPGLKVENWLE